MTQSKQTIKRYSLALREDVFSEIERVASEKQMSFIEVLRRFIKIGLMIERIEKSPDSVLILKEGDTERQIILI